MADKDFSTKIVAAAKAVARSTKAQALLAYVDAVPDLPALAELAGPDLKLILVARDEKGEQQAGALDATVITVPQVNLTRIGQVKMAVLIAFSQRLLEPGQTFVFLTGVSGRPIDTLMVMSVGDEYEVVQSVAQPRITEHVRRAVFQRVMALALALANEGREGIAVGAMFVVGDYRELSKFCQQNIINPFKGYPESARNILDDAMTETVKCFSTLDGAFVVKGNGVIVSAGTTLRPGLAGEPLPQGLGTRHSTAAAITASTKCIAVTVSQSSGTVRLWRRGQMITEIEKAPRSAPPPPPTPAPGTSGS